MATGSIPRSVRWRIDLDGKGLLRHEPEQWSSVLTEERRRYADLKKRVLRAPDGSYPEGFGMETNIGQTSNGPTPVDVNNPLSLADDNPWHSHFANLTTLEQIQKDVIRAFPEEEDRFKSGPLGGQEKFVSQLSAILFVWSLSEENLNVGYRQGMHEIAGVCWLIVKEDAEKGMQSPSSSRQLLVQADDVEADSFALFQTIMFQAKRWYEWKSVGSSKLPIQQHCDMVEESLASNDVDLARHLKRLGVSMSIFAIRWIRLLFLRELPQDIAIEVWESLFELDPSLFLVDHICVALIIRIRDVLLASDNPTALRALLNYPAGSVESGESVRALMDEARQAHRQHTAVLSGKEMPYTRKVPGSWNDADLASRSGAAPFGYTAPTLTELTRGISAQSLGAGFNRAITNVQRTVNAAYQAHAAQNTSNDGFPPSMNVISGRREVAADQTPKQQLEKLRAVNGQMGKTMNDIIDVLQKRWAREMESETNAAKNDAKPAEEEQQLSLLVSLTALKHIRDVLSGQAVEFDPSVMQLGKEDTNGNEAHAQPSTPSTYPPTATSKGEKDRTFGARFQRSVDDIPIASASANIPPSTSNTASLDESKRGNAQSTKIARPLAASSAVYDPLGVGGS
ncbi:RabGAP/TBC [Meira miltonrushii]|uniref:RabGAP/TBC n=1 Tax=Meira miltonrushii TaxID=1280837 RepID=A0A316V9W1_9BASI|nr:RabGAP/TBC [Meira miltonrushii]PWN32963.1 RabGAP/TBC [Meira miltonrushii]